MCGTPCDPELGLQALVIRDVNFCQWILRRLETWSGPQLPWDHPPRTPQSPVVLPPICPGFHLLQLRAAFPWSLIMVRRWEQCWERLLPGSGGSTPPQSPLAALPGAGSSWWRSWKLPGRERSPRGLGQEQGAVTARLPGWLCCPLEWG